MVAQASSPRPRKNYRDLLPTGYTVRPYLQKRRRTERGEGEGEGERRGKEEDDDDLDSVRQRHI